MNKGISNLRLGGTILWLRWIFRRAAIRMRRSMNSDDTRQIEPTEPELALATPWREMGVIHKICIVI